MELVMKKPSQVIKDNASSWAKGLKKIEVTPLTQSEPLINNSCHYNSVNQVKLGKAVAVVEVVMFDGDDRPTAHYININEQGEYYDITLGWSWSGCDYRLVRIIHSSSNELSSAHEMLRKLKKKMYEMTPKYVRFLHRGDEWDLF